MGTIYRNSYTKTDPATGVKTRRLCRNWTVEYRDHRGKRVRADGGSARAGARQVLARLEREAEEVRLGLRRPGQENAARLLVGGPGEPGLLGEYLAHVAARDVTPHHVGNVRRAVGKAVRATGAELPRDLDGARLAAHLADRRRAGLSAATSNAILGMCRGFARWLVDRGALAADPFRGVEPVAAEPDRRRQRRALTPDEFGRLLAAAGASRAAAHGLSGPDRAVLYLAAARTGLRRGELASLTPESFDLVADPPVYRLAAAAAKNRREAVLPVAPDLAARLRTWLRGRPAGQPLWPGEWSQKGHSVAMVRADLGAAGVPFVDAAGLRCDFHALRLTFVTHLALAGVPLAAAQKLARHSTPVLTANVYTRLRVADLAAELGRLRGAG